MEWTCELPLRTDKHFLVPAAARELLTMVRTTPVLLNTDTHDLTQRSKHDARIGIADAEEMVIDEDGWPRIRVTCVFEEDKLPAVIRDALKAGTVGVGFDATVSTHRCNGDEVHTMIGGFESIDALVIVPIDADPVSGGKASEMPRLMP